MTGPDGFFLGVDLGTSHTVAMLRRPDGRTRPLLFDGQPLLPSAVFLDTTGRLHVGRDALRLGYAEPGRFEPNPKRHIDPVRVSMLKAADGAVDWARNGVAARLDGGNVLLFSKALSTTPDDPSLAGLHVGSEEEPLGPLTGVRSATCAWNTSIIACVADKDFMVQRFTG